MAIQVLTGVIRYVVPFVDRTLKIYETNAQALTEEARTRRMRAITTDFIYRSLVTGLGAVVAGSLSRYSCEVNTFYDCYVINKLSVVLIAIGVINMAILSGQQTYERIIRH